MIYILYSNDYEVYLGGNYFPESEVLIKTTKDVLSACEDIGVPITLFCDLPCLWRYRELGYTEFPDAVDHQLKNTIDREHDVQAHIHPHWFETEIVYNEKGIPRYDFDLSKFLLGNWIPQGGLALQEFCGDIFRRAKSYLEDLLRPVNPSYRCIAFRAGGYGMQPNTKEILEALIDAGYLIDSSIVPGMVLDSNVNRIDFTEVPQEGNYSVSPELGLNRVSEEGLFEIPVLALRQGEASWLLAKALPLKVVRYFLERTKQKQMGFSIQSAGPTKKRKKLLGKISDQVDAIRDGRFILELCKDVGIMVDATRHYINRYNSGDRDLLFAVSCHSKSADPGVLDALKRFHRRLERIYGGQLKAMTFQEAGRWLNLTRR